MAPRSPAGPIAAADDRCAPTAAAHTTTHDVRVSPHQTSSRQKSRVYDTLSGSPQSRAAAVAKLYAGDSSGGAEIRDCDRRMLEHWIRSPTTPQRVVQRSRIVLLALLGLPIREVAFRCGVTSATVRLWTTRVTRDGLTTLLRDAPGRGRRGLVDVPTFLERLRQADLLDASGRPVSLRRAGACLGVSASAVWRALRKASLERDRPTPVRMR
jgi:transposase